MSEEILKPDTSLGRYAIKRLLGRGAFGVTYLAERIDPRLAVAIKEYFPVDFAQRNDDGTTVNPRSTGAAGGEFNTGLRKFLEESRVLGRFDSPHIVRVVDTFERNGTAYMVMQYEEGSTLDQLLDTRSQPLTESEILSIFIPVLEGLKDIHATWYVHRDIKPNNIYIRDDGSPLLIDFGATRDALAVKRGGMTEYLTPGFAPAEQYDRTRDQGPWTDIYAVGATMYYCVTRIKPPDGRARAHGEETMMPAVEAAPAFYHAELLENIDWMMAPQAADRPQSVDKVLNRLKALRERINNEAASPGDPTLRRETVQRRGREGDTPAPPRTESGTEPAVGKPSAGGDGADTQIVPDATASGAGPRWAGRRGPLAGAGAALAALAIAAVILFGQEDAPSKEDLYSGPSLDRQLEYLYRLDLNARETQKGADGFFSDTGVLVATDEQNRRYAVFNGNGLMQADNISVDFEDFTLALWMKPEIRPARFASALSLHAGAMGHTGGGDRSARVRITRDKPVTSDPDAVGDTGGDSAEPVPHVQALVNLEDGGDPHWVAAPVPLNTWTHVVFIRRADGKLDLFVNGESPDAQQASVVTEDHPAPAGDFSFTNGKIRAAASNFHGPDGDGPGGERGRSRWVGGLDDVRVYGRALTETEVKTLSKQ